MKKKVILIISIIVLIFLGILIFQMFNKKIPKKTTVVIDGQSFNVEVADSMALRAQGLSGRTSLGENDGMLFIFPFAAKYYGFWMKDMNFPLDMIWINGDKIAGVAENVPVPQPGQSLLSLPQFYPPQAVDKVLEVNAGTVSKFGFKAGDTVEMSL